MQCGGTLDYQYPGNEVYYKFYEAIGWLEGTVWKLNWEQVLDQRNLVVKGHFPGVLVWMYRKTYRGAPLLNHQDMNNASRDVSSRVAHCGL